MLEKIELNDIDLCVNIDDNYSSDDEEMSLADLRALCDRHDVEMSLEEECGPNGWPTFSFRGEKSQVMKTLIELGFDKESANDLMEGNRDD